jgi:hypothetical protein
MIPNSLTVYLPPDLLVMLNKRSALLAEIRTSHNKNGQPHSRSIEFEELNKKIVVYLGNLALTEVTKTL